MSMLMLYSCDCQHVDFGYDISDYEAIQPEYGTMEDFDELIAKAKQLGKVNAQKSLLCRLLNMRFYFYLNAITLNVCTCLQV